MSSYAILIKRANLVNNSESRLNLFHHRASIVLQNTDQQETSGKFFMSFHLFRDIAKNRFSIRIQASLKEGLF